MTAMTQAPSDFKTKPAARPFSNPYVAGALLGLVLFAAFFFTGNGLGASGGLNRMIIWVIDLVAPQHSARVSYLVSYAGGDKNALDHWIVLMTVGIALGGFASAWMNRRFAWETIKGGLPGCRAPRPSGRRCARPRPPRFGYWSTAR